MYLVKKLVFVLLFAGLLSGCQKDTISPTLVGDWLWQGSSGGLAGTVIKPKSTQRIIVNFGADNHFSIFRNDTLWSTGAFQITQARSIYTGKDEPFLQTSDVVITNPLPNTGPVGINGIFSFSGSNTQLSIADNAYDGFTNGFRRN